MKFSLRKVMGATALVSVMFSPVFVPVVLAQNATPQMSGEMRVVDNSVTVGDLELSGAFTRAMPPRAVTGGGFVTIVNNGDEDDRLVSVSSSVAAHTELHVMSIVDDVMRMRSEPDGFVIPAGETTQLKPGGKHIMFIDVQTPFAKGDDIKVTLHFEKAGDIELSLRALEIGAKGMMPMGADHSNMDASMQSGSD